VELRIRQIRNSTGKDCITTALRGFLFIESGNSKTILAQQSINNSPFHYRHRLRK
jgi:hypothetical protein